MTNEATEVPRKTHQLQLNASIILESDTPITQETAVRVVSEWITNSGESFSTYAPKTKLFSPNHTVKIPEQ